VIVDTVTYVVCRGAGLETGGETIPLRRRLGRDGRARRAGPRSRAREEAFQTFAAPGGLPVPQLECGHALEHVGAVVVALGRRARGARV
jgi:hypothetical protein